MKKVVVFLLYAALQRKTVQEPKQLLVPEYEKI